MLPTPATKNNFKRRSNPLQYTQRTLKRELKKCIRILILNFCLVSATIIFGGIIIYIRLKYNTNTIDIIRNEHYFQPLVGELDFRNSTPHWNENVQFNAPAIKAERKDWHDYAAMVADKKRKGPGEQGKAVFTAEDSMKAIEKHLALENGFNALVSDLISVNRSVPDVRERRPLLSIPSAVQLVAGAPYIILRETINSFSCHKKRYLAKLPTVSIVIPCRNEYTSVLQRTLHSIVNRTPKSLLKEIIIVDDNSYRGYTVDDITEYAAIYFPNLVKFVRLHKHRGLIYARVAGAKVATSDVLVFFDSHVECNYNWLPPLLEPIAINDRIVTSPQIDWIEHNDFSYNNNGNGHRGGFNWDLSFLYLFLTLEPGADVTKPFKDPVMMGGLFAISRRFFWELGGYDVGLNVWGSEQFEISFKIWMCGGMLLSIPCSHVAHIFRGPWNNDRGQKNAEYLARNNKRVAEVWMDEYKKYVYATNPELYRKLKPGNLSEQHAVRKRLKCKSFKWYLEYVAPDILETNPVESEYSFASGALQSVAHPDLCLTSLLQSAEINEVNVYGCAPNHGQPHSSQYWNFDLRQELKNQWRNFCLDVPEIQSNARVVMIPCHHEGGNQFWFYNKKRKWLMHGISDDYCLELREDDVEMVVVLNECDERNVRMRWRFGFVNDSLVPNRYQMF